MLVLTGVAEIWHLVVLQVVRGVATSFFFPASQGIVPQTVSARLLQEANALLRLTRNGTQIGGVAAGGILVAAIGPGWSLAFDAATYFAGAAFLLALRLPRDLTMPERHFVRELREGWDAFRSRAWLWGIVVQFAFVNAAGVGAWAVLGPVVADDDLGGAAAWGFILAAQAAGFIVGGVFTLRYRPDRLLLVATLAIFPMALPILLLALPAPAVLIALAAFTAGFGMEIFGVFWDVAMQQQISADQLLARVLVRRARLVRLHPARRGRRRASGGQRRRHRDARRGRSCHRRRDGSRSVDRRGSEPAAYGRRRGSRRLSAAEQRLQARFPVEEAVQRALRNALLGRQQADLACGRGLVPV